ncbi:MAG: 50S ribosomal protein L10 [Myxococcota bacterium]
MLSRADKESQVAELKEKLDRATSMYVVDYRGLGVEDANQLRRRVRKEGGGDFEYKVTKNAVLRRATEGSDFAGMHEHFAGPTAVAISFGDPAGLAKILDEFSNDHEVFELKGGVVSGETLTPKDIAVLATLPSLDELRGKIVGLLQAPASKLARLVSEPGAGLARIVSAKSQQEG